MNQMPLATPMVPRAYQAKTDPGILRTRQSFQFDGKLFAGKLFAGKLPFDSQQRVDLSSQASADFSVTVAQPFLVRAE
jgi:hypothetical protein